MNRLFRKTSLKSGSSPKPRALPVVQASSLEEASAKAPAPRHSSAAHHVGNVKRDPGAFESGSLTTVHTLLPWQISQQAQLLPRASPPKLPLLALEATTAPTPCRDANDAERSTGAIRPLPDDLQNLSYNDEKARRKARDRLRGQKERAVLRQARQDESTQGLQYQRFVSAARQLKHLKSSQEDGTLKIRPFTRSLAKALFLTLEAR